MADIVLISPRFEVSYWGMEYGMPLLGKKARNPVGALPLLAALTPAEHRVTLIDEAVEPIDYDRCARADVVGITGMSVQRRHMREILAELKRRGVFTVVGGPWVSVDEDYFEGLADVIFVGEAEETWPRFLEEWHQGRHQSRYEQAGPTDMTKVPTPRFDLLDMRQYHSGSIQFSRGCPFQCEFCDIIVIFGRRPRLKTSAQVIAELEAVRMQGVRNALVVDDNFIGNKKAIKALLHDLIAWQQKEGYPFSFVTEASIDLADDPELMRLMVAANFTHVFVGVESPNLDSLRETKKFQNLRAGGTLLEKIHRIQASDLEVMCGMIVGFDNDGPDVFESQRRFIMESRIISALIGMLYAVPRTPLHDRLRVEGRLDPLDDPEFGTNVIPLQLGREELRDGYLTVMRRLYEADAYFTRFEQLYIDLGIFRRRGVGFSRRRHPIRYLKSRLLSYVGAMRVFHQVVSRPGLGGAPSSRVPPAIVATCAGTPRSCRHHFSR
jgi:radical SAM superfamily enzyme YgiQ (UPF0313 family)